MKKNILLTLIFVLAFATRVWKVSSLPSILNRDEAAIAYNAYLLSETGYDEWGEQMPLTLKSFGDYKLVGYPAVVIPLIEIFPFSDLMVRLPSVLAGSVLTILAYFFGKRFGLSSNFALLFSLVIAVMPVFFFYSRMAFEANLALTYFVGVILLLFTKAEGRKRLMFDVSASIITLIAVFTYNTPFLLLPFLIILIPIHRGLKNIRSWSSVVSMLVLVFVFAASILLPLSTRKSGITIFSDETIWSESVAYREQYSGITQKLLGNRYLFYGKIITHNTFASFLPWFLVQNGGTHPWHSLPSHGHLYWVVYFAFLSGLFLLLYTIILQKKAWSSLFSKPKTELLDPVIITYLLFISLIPSVVTVDAPHATRSLLFFFVACFMAAFALQAMTKALGNKSPSAVKPLLAVVGFIFLLETYSYGKSYFVDYPQNQQMFMPGFDSVITEVIDYDDSDTIDDKSSSIAVVDDAGYHYILAAWYGQVSPDVFTDTIVMQQPDSIGFHYGERLANLHFIAHPDDRSSNETTLVQWNGAHWEITKL